MIASRAAPVPPGRRFTARRLAVGWVTLFSLAAPMAQPRAQDTVPVASSSASEDLNRTFEALSARNLAPATLARARPRISQILGAPLHSASGEVLGEIVDIVLRDDGGPLAIIRAAGNAGMLVSLPIGQLRWVDERVTWPESGAEGLRGRPAFYFDAGAR